MSDEEKVEQIAAEAYQVIGTLLRKCELFDAEIGQKALDYFAGYSNFDGSILPFWIKE